MSTGVPFGMWTPAQAIDELIDMRSKDPSFRAWYPSRMRRIRKYLATITFRGIPMLDFPMRSAEIDAVLQEAWAVLKQRDREGAGLHLTKQLYDKGLLN